MNGLLSLMLTGLMIAATEAPHAEPIHEAPCQSSGRVPAARVPAFVDCIQKATARYADRAAAVADGYRLIGSDFPAMGEHWIHVGRTFDGRIDPARPEVLGYAMIDGRARLLGVAYALPLLAGEPAPEWPAGAAAWHNHIRSIEDETVEPHLEHDHGEQMDRVAMVHVWTEVPNPDGPFAADNWAIPFVRAKIAVPPTVTPRAGRALSLVVGGGDAVVATASRELDLTPALHAVLRAEVQVAAARIQQRLPDTSLLEAEWAGLWLRFKSASPPSLVERLGVLSIR